MNSASGVDRARVDVTKGDDTTEPELSQLYEVEELTSIGTVPSIRELDREELTQVYQYYTMKPVKPPVQLAAIHKEADTASTNLNYKLFPYRVVGSVKEL